jgi:hypothetical protein
MFELSRFYKLPLKLIILTYKKKFQFFNCRNNSIDLLRLSKNLYFSDLCLRKGQIFYSKLILYFKSFSDLNIPFFLFRKN